MMLHHNDQDHYNAMFGENTHISYVNEKEEEEDGKGAMNYFCHIERRRSEKKDWKPSFSFDKKQGCM